MPKSCVLANVFFLLKCLFVLEGFLNFCSPEQCLVVPYINPANHTPGVQTDHVPCVTSFHRVLKTILLNHEAHSLNIYYLARSSGPLYKSWQPCPWSSNIFKLPCQGEGVIGIDGAQQFSWYYSRFLDNLNLLKS